MVVMRVALHLVNPFVESSPSGKRFATDESGPDQQIERAINGGAGDANAVGAETHQQIFGGMGEITGGGVDIWALTVNLTWSPSSTGSGFYLIGGVGVHSVEGRLHENGLVYYPPICDPWFWYCYPGGVGPGTIIQAKVSTTEFGWNAGVGLTFETSSGSEWFLEAKFHSVDTSRATTEFVPLVIGFRW